MMTGLEGLARRFQPDPLAGANNQYTHHENLLAARRASPGHSHLDFCLYTFPKAVWTSCGETPGPRQAHGRWPMSAPERWEYGLTKKQWLRSMMLKHILLAVACPQGVISSSLQAGPLQPVY